MKGNKLNFLIFGVVVFVLIGIQVVLVQYLYPKGILQTIRVTQLFSLSAVISLYLSLIISPLKHSFPEFFLNPYLTRSRKYIGMATFIFASLHGLNALQKQLGGLNGLTYLNSSFLVGVLIGISASFILSILAVTSLEFVSSKISRLAWKRIHRGAYITGILAIIHALMLGSHFEDLSGLIPRIFFLLVFILLILESVRIDNYLKKVIFVPVTVVVSLILLSLSQTVYKNLGIHSNHSNKSQISNSSRIYMPGMIGDRSKKYSVEFNQDPKLITANEELILSYKVFNDATLSPELIFATPYEKPMHLIIVSEDFEYFTHIHPVAIDLAGNYSTQVILPKDGFYRAYLDFQPLGGIEQQVPYSISVGSGIKGSYYKYSLSYDSSDSEHLVSINLPENATSKSLGNGDSLISVSVKDLQTNSPVTNLSPYLNTFGHLVLIKEGDYAYLHGHALQDKPPLTDDLGGPNLQFALMPVSGKIQSGRYHVYLQIKPGGKLKIFRFVIEIK